LPSRYAVSTATKGVLVLISKVLQKFAEMSYFDPIKEPTMALFNDFIYKHSESVQQYFCSFCVRILIFHFSFFHFSFFFFFFSKNQNKFFNNNLKACPRKNSFLFAS